jgi:hypothetical protein
MSYSRCTYELQTVYTREELAGAGVDTSTYHSLFAEPCRGCECYHPCGDCGNWHCGCPTGKACVATTGLEP